MIDQGQYTSGRIAIANLSASIEGLEQFRLAERVTFENSVTLSKLLFLRGDVLGRIADHDRAELIANEAVALSPGIADALFIGAQLAGRFHRFKEAGTLLAQALAAGHPKETVDAEKAALFQATGQYCEALTLREKLAKDQPGIHTLGALASLLAESGDWSNAKDCYAAALGADEGVSPLPASGVLFEWGVSAMRCGDLDRAERVLAQVAAIVPAHVPGQGHRAEVALARGELELALSLITPLLEISDDPEYRGTYAEILAACCDRRAEAEAKRAAVEYECLLARRPEAYADHAAAFFMGIGNRPQRAVELAEANLRLRDTSRAQHLLARARRKAGQVSLATFRTDAQIEQAADAPSLTTQA
jgi:predicted Zn-dependent protease